jgi:hypothetical protein
MARGGKGDVPSMLNVRLLRYWSKKLGFSTAATMCVKVELWLCATMLSAVVLCSVSSSSCSVYCSDRVVDTIVEADVESVSLRLNATKFASRCQKAKTQSATS